MSGRTVSFVLTTWGRCEDQMLSETEGISNLNHTYKFNYEFKLCSKRKNNINNKKIILAYDGHLTNPY